MGWTISWEDFRTYVQRFLTISEEINDGWIWHGDQEQLAGAYIVKKEKRLTRNQKYLPNQDGMDLFEDTSCQTEVRQDRSNEDDQVVQVSSGFEKECSWEYHVLYSPSYATPVLVFNAFTSDGHLVSLESLWKGLLQTHEVLQQLRWEALSQQEHPILRRPFFHLHPCKTAEFLNIHQGTSANPIVTWLSSMGPAIGLHLDNAYGQLVQNQI